VAGRPTSAAERAALNSFVKFMRAHARLAGMVSAQVAAHGLTPGQFGVLETLWHLGPLCQNELGEKLLSSKPNISAVITNLERDGLVRRAREALDRRSVRVHLTAQGERRISVAFPAFAHALTGAMGCLSGPELKALGVLSKKLGLGLPA
jgi:MarR family 2-MHQ and catechol resistance regulon transcriptional repressor